MNVLLALVLGLVGVLEPAGVLNGDSLAVLGNGAGALLDDGLGNTHADELRDCLESGIER